MKIATFNANSIRARLDIVLDWMDEQQPDLLAIQETKVENDKFPKDEFIDSGWHVIFQGQKSYNGVAIVSKEPIAQFQAGFVDHLWVDDCRILTARYGDLTLINTYVPNGSAVGSEKFDYKLRWLDRFLAYAEKAIQHSKHVVWLGDINIAPTELDVYDSPKHLGGVGHHPEEFARLSAITQLGLSDLYRKFHSEGGEYTFWEFVIPRAVERNIGWRIDHIYATSELAERCTQCEIDIAPRKKEKPSDHTFVWAEFDLG